MSQWIIAVGGAGQAVLHYYTLLFLIGAVDQRFSATVIDTDHPNRSLIFLKDEFLPSAREGMGEVKEEDSQVPSIELKRPAEVGGGTVSEALVGSKLPEAARYQHPAQAYFASGSLKVDGYKGLFARPCLSAVVSRDAVREAIPADQIRDDTTITIVGSCVGGTGAGLIIPLVSHLDNVIRQRERVSVRLVLLGRYFRSTGNVLGDNDYDRFSSNRTLFLRSLKEASDQVHSFAFIEEPAMEGRDIRAEQEGKFLALPDEGAPYWLALCALAHLLSDTVGAAQPGFGAKEVDVDRFVNAIDIEYARRRLQRGWAVAEAMATRRIVASALQEPRPESIWGKPLAALLTRYWRMARHRFGDDPATYRNIASGIDRKMNQIWLSGAAGYALKKFLPDATYRSAPVAWVNRTNWRTVPENVSSSIFQNAEQCQTAIASALLFQGLRFGGK